MNHQGHIHAQTVSLEYIRPLHNYFGQVPHSKQQHNVSGAPTHYGLILTVRVTEDTILIWVNEVFCKILGVEKLTSKIRQQLQEVLPAEVNILDVTWHGGMKGYELCEQSARDWLKAVRHHDDVILPSI